MQYQRSHRVGEAIHKEISALLVKGLKDPRVGFVTITGVDVPSDLHIAKVYYTVIGSDKEKADTQVVLEKATPYFRRELGRRLRLRHVPDILFKYDESIDYGNKIESLLKDIHDGQVDDQADN